MRTPFPYLGNGWTDSAEILYVAGDPLAKLFTRPEGGVQLCVSTCARAVVSPFLYLGNGWTDRAEIRCVARGALAVRFTQDGRHLH